MTTLSDTFVRKNPREYRVTRLDTPESVDYYGKAYGRHPLPDGTFRLPTEGREVRTAKPEDAYLVEELQDEVMTGISLLLTEQELYAKLEPRTYPFYEYGVAFLPRRNDVVVHESKDAAVAALDAMPVLRDSGSYGIARRVTTSPGNWEIVG